MVKLDGLIVLLLKIISVMWVGKIFVLLRFLVLMIFVLVLVLSFIFNFIIIFSVYINILCI